MNGICSYRHNRSTQYQLWLQLNLIIYILLRDGDLLDSKGGSTIASLIYIHWTNIHHRLKEGIRVERYVCTPRKKNSWEYMLEC